MIVKLVEVCQAMSVSSSGGYTLREVFINPEHVVCLRSDDLTRQRLQENKLPPELDERQEFTRIQLNRGSNGLDLIVVGSPSIVEKKLKMSRQLIRG